MARRGGGIIGQLIKLILSAFFQAGVQTYKASKKTSRRKA
jgi:hypothetical protein